VCKNRRSRRPEAIQAYAAMGDRFLGERERGREERGRERECGEWLGSKEPPSPGNVLRCPKVLIYIKF